MRRGGSDDVRVRFGEARLPEEKLPATQGKEDMILIVTRTLVMIVS